jgi:hypothetical protein
MVHERDNEYDNWEDETCDEFTEAANYLDHFLNEGAIDYMIEHRDVHGFFPSLNWAKDRATDDSMRDTLVKALDDRDVKIISRCRPYNPGLPALPFDFNRRKDLKFVVPKDKDPKDYIKADQRKQLNEYMDYYSVQPPRFRAFENCTAVEKFGDDLADSFLVTVDKQGKDERNMKRLQLPTYTNSYGKPLDHIDVLDFRAADSLVGLTVRLSAVRVSARYVCRTVRMQVRVYSF